MRKILLLANNDVGLYNFRREVLQELLNNHFIVYMSLPIGENIEKMVDMGCIFIETPVARRGVNLVLNYI